MNDFIEHLRGTSARLVNTRWGFASAWVALPLAIEQFAAHRAELQDDLALEWREGPGRIKRLEAKQVRQWLATADDAAMFPPASGLGETRKR